MTDLERIQYRKEICRLTVSKDFKNEIDSFKMVLDSAMAIMYSHKKESKLNEIDSDGHLLIQIAFVKSMSLLKLADGLKYVNPLDKTSLTGIYDPFGMGNLVRSQYEAFCNFNNIYIQSMNDSERKLKYYLWVLSGLKYRQKFPVYSEEFKKKKEEEAAIINDYLNLVKLNECYIQLEEQSRINIDQCIKKKEWQIKIDHNKSHKIAWHEMFGFAGVNQLYDEQYAYLSSISHPSNLAVIQFKSMYSGETVAERSDYQSMRTIMNTSKSILAMILRDYITYFDLSESHFEKLPVINQMLINILNKTFRGEDYKLNKSLELLG